MTETAAPAAAPQITIAPTPADSGESDMFSDASSFHEFQSMANKRSKESRAQAKQQKVEAKATPPATTAQPPVAEPTESLHPPTETPQQDAPDETLETSEPVTETPPDPAAEAAQAADMELWGKVKDWMQMGGEVPAELADVPIKLPNGQLEPLSEVVKGFMRQDDHTNGWREAKRAVEEANAKVQAYEQHFNEIEDPDPVKGGDKLYEVYTRRGNRKQLRAAAEILAREEDQDELLAKGVGYAVMRQYGIQDERDYRVEQAKANARAERAKWRDDQDALRQRDWEIQRLRQQNQQTQAQTQQAQVNKTVENQIAQMRPRAFKQLGIADDAETQVLFRRKLAARAEQTGAAVLTPELVMEAARMTRDHIAREKNGPPAAKPQPRTFQPQLGGGAGKIAGSGKQDDLADDDAFAAKFKLRRL